VVADAAYASRVNMARIRELGYWSVLALPRTWEFTQIRIPTVNTQPRRTFWVYAKRARLRHLGDATVVLSKRRRNDGPKQTTILVTNLPRPVTAREIVGVYLRRWWVAVGERTDGSGRVGPASGHPNS
jgi:hypothetical protein